MQALWLLITSGLCTHASQPHPHKTSVRVNLQSNRPGTTTENVTRLGISCEGANFIWDKLWMHQPRHCYDRLVKFPLLLKKNTNVVCPPHKEHDQIFKFYFLYACSADNYSCRIHCNWWHCRDGRWPPDWTHKDFLYKKQSKITPWNLRGDWKIANGGAHDIGWLVVVCCQHQVLQLTQFTNLLPGTFFYICTKIKQSLYEQIQQ